MSHAAPHAMTRGEQDARTLIGIPQHNRSAARDRGHSTIGAPLNIR
ncbi:hypothetical protein [Burkholderia pyrrocinia]|nr:hypothetical protein [Burkholderia pyrrocinia]QVN21192.1 hypothetical protein JYG32_32205 [Burkholderia pyrrocinia]